MNPLLDFSGLPRFAEVKPEHVNAAIEHLLSLNRCLVEKIVADESATTWATFVAPLEDANEQLSRAWSQVSHLNAVVNSPELRAAYNENLPKVTEFYADLSQNLKLFEKFKALKAAPEFVQLSAPQKKIVENEIRDFRLGGAELAETQKERFKAIQEALASAAAKFEENLLDTTNAYANYIERAEEVAGLTADARRRHRLRPLLRRSEAARRGRSAWGRRRPTRDGPGAGPPHDDDGVRVHRRRRHERDDRDLRQAGVG